MTDYVKLTTSEKTYAEKTLLESQARFISLLQHLSNYHKQRNEELKSKLELKSKIEEVKSSLEQFDKTLPTSSFKDEHEKNKISNAKLEFPTIEPGVETKEIQLEKELEEIRIKLARLR